MRLSKIKLSGFKSFVDTTTIAFPTNLTGIVGPNGCGKSNVIDAIRWVLGESSAKTLRGDSMADVIFNGSSGRKPVGQASIELIFDNSDGKLAGAYAGFAEVSVRRVVSRDGTSQYYLNNSRCRRKDITHILLGTGVGSHGYSIIEQGMISRLVEAKPEDMRAFLEEAAGISKYKERRRETEHRIRHTRDNLERLTDIRDELDKQLSHLKRQASAAERYKTLKSEERRAEAELLHLRVRELTSSLQEEEKKLRDKQLALDAAITAEREIETSIEKLRVNLADRHDEFNEAQGVYYQVGADIARLEQAIQHRKGTIARQETDLGEVNEQIAEIEGHMDNDRGQLAELDRSLGRLSPELADATAELSSIERELETLEEAVDEHRRRSAELSRAIGDAERVAQVDTARMEQLADRRQRASAEREEQANALGGIRIADLEQRVDQLVGAEERQRGQLADVLRELESVTGRVRALRDDQASGESRLETLRDELRESQSRLAALEALQAAALRDLSEEGQNWLAANGLAAARKVVDLLEVEPGWERAVEAALTGYFHAVEVDSLTELAGGLSALGESGVAVLETSATIEPAVRYIGGMPSLASKLRAPASARPLLYGCFAADSVEVALRSRHELASGQSFVTPDGALITNSSVLTMSGDDPQLGVIARGDEIDRLNDRMAEQTRACEEATARLVEIRNEIESLEGRTVALQGKSSALQTEYTETKTQLEGTRTRLEEARQRHRDLERSILSCDDEIAETDSIVKERRAAVEAASARQLQLQDELARHDDDGQRLHGRYTEVRRAAEDKREHVKEIEISVEAQRSSKASAAAALTRIQSQLENLGRRQSELQRQIGEAGAPLEEEQRTLGDRLEARTVAEARLAEARSAVESCEASVRDTESERTTAQQAVADAREVADAMRLGVREVQVRVATVTEQLSATGFNAEELGAQMPDDATTAAWIEKLESISRRIQRLGSINMAAIDEFEEQSERKKYLDQQFEDLSSALETLEAAIRKIDRETREKFKDTFDRANQGLGRLFPRLFGGGQAYLELESDDLLNAGVTVMARPPGKRISTIHLMSGGEKALTAVALVFSIFELNPAPFCLLDEVDAPLDDANVGRFSEIVREMSDRVQFVLITHNKTTMESMNQLTGVTMHEPGVSRMVAVDIDEAVRLAAI